MRPHPPGVLTVDVVVGVLGVLLWRHVVALPVRDLLPSLVARLLPVPAATRPRDLPLLAGAVVVGAVTHVVWDAFTHPGRFGVRWIGWLGDDHGGVPGHQWAQLASGAVGGVVVLGWVVARLCRDDSTAPPRQGSARLEEQLGALLVVLVALLVGSLVGLVTSPPDLESMLFRLVTRGGLGLGLGLLAVCLVWHARERAGRRTRVGAEGPGR
ncbi:hypothetical protein GCM10009867_01180 [Pedococcus aerophilus]|uniref:DUF4184 family protein n=1 Tax=Pedococcus aerophilus TaxID=436356 RepID=A0ABN3UDE8_9MICO